MVMLAFGSSELSLYLMPVVAVMLVVYGISQVISDTKRSDKVKIMARLSNRSTTRPEDREKRIRESLLRHQNQEDEHAILQMIGQLKLVPKIQNLLDQANVECSASKFLAWMMGASLGSIVILLIAGFSPLTALVVGVVVFFLPLLYLKRRRNRRIAKLVNQLPDVFEMMGQALRAGQSMVGAIQLVSEQLPDPIGTEFCRVFQEQNLGLRLEDALLNFANRCDQMDIRFFVTAVLIQRQTGGDLAEILDKISTIIRGRVELMGQVKALTAEGRMSGWVLLALPVLCYMASLVLNPKYAMRLIVEPYGRMMLIGAGVMQLMGLAMIKKIVNIKV